MQRSILTIEHTLCDTLQAEPPPAALLGPEECPAMSPHADEEPNDLTSPINQMLAISGSTSGTYSTAMC
jgi:hypothetical protein